MSFELRFSKQAANYLSRLDRRTQERIARALQLVVDDPFSPPTKPLTALRGRRAVRVGGWRLIYDAAAAAAAEILIVAINVRGEIYRDI